MSVKQQAQANSAPAELLQSWVNRDYRTPLLTPRQTTHTQGKGETLTFENVRIDFPLRPCKSLTLPFLM